MFLLTASQYSCIIYSKEGENILEVSVKRFIIEESIDQSSIRLYLKSKHTEDAYTNREAYDVILTITYETPTIVYVSKLMSRVRVTGFDFKEFKQYLRDKGVHLLRYERSGKIIVENLLCQESKNQLDQLS